MSIPQLKYFLPVTSLGKRKSLIEIVKHGVIQLGSSNISCSLPHSLYLCCFLCLKLSLPGQLSLPPLSLPGQLLIFIISYLKHHL